MAHSMAMFQFVRISWLLSSLIPVNGDNTDPFIPMSRMLARFPGDETNDSSFVSKFKSRIARPPPPQDEENTTSIPASWGFEDEEPAFDSSSPNNNNNEAFSPLRYLSNGAEEASSGSERRQMLLGDVLSLTSSEGTTPRHPVVYRYYGRNQALTHSYGSIPFLLLGPNVDHWKVAGQELASRGYNAIACERVLTEGDVDQANKAKKRSLSSSSSSSSVTMPDSPIPSWNESALLILQLLDALRWNKAVLVACDSLTLVAIEAAMLLAPHRIAGVVLCGRIPELNELLPKEGGVVAEEIRRRMAGSYNSVDQYLKKHLRCPSTIVWDGAIPPLVADSFLGDESSSAATESIASGRSLILGGGSAPHRRRPQLFAWALTRFVEEQVDHQRHHRKEEREKQHRRAREEADSNGEDGGEDQLPKNNRKLPFHLALIFSPGSMVVYGRILATALFYGIVMKTLIFQYENIRWGIFNVKSKIDLIVSLPRRVMRAITGVLRSSLSITPLPNPRTIFATLSGFLPFWSRGSSSSEASTSTGMGPGVANEGDDDPASNVELDTDKANATDAVGNEQDDGDEETEPAGDNDDAQNDETTNGGTSDESDKDDSEPEQTRIRPIMFLDHVVV